MDQCSHPLMCFSIAMVLQGESAEGCQNRSGFELHNWCEECLCSEALQKKGLVNSRQSVEFRSSLVTRSTKPRNCAQSSLQPIPARNESQVLGRTLQSRQRDVHLSYRKEAEQPADRGDSLEFDCSDLGICAITYSLITPRGSNLLELA